MHHRLSPRTHRFEYGLFLLSVDLDELPVLSRRLRFLGWNRRNLYELRDRDHLEYPGSHSARGLKNSVRAWLASESVEVPEDVRMTLVTLPRIAGYVFNPVSFFFLETRGGEPIGAVAEVGNTFGELKPYFIPSEPRGDGRFSRVVPKQFYVSPFSDLEVLFDFRLRRPGERLAIAINDVTPGGRTLLVSTLRGDRIPLTDGQLLRLTLRYPLVTLRVMTLIHWQALQLWRKKLPWHRKADGLEAQRGVFRPHGSLREGHRPPAPSTVNP